MNNKMGIHIYKQLNPFLKMHKNEQEERKNKKQPTMIQIHSKF